MFDDHHQDDEQERRDRRENARMMWAMILIVGAVALQEGIRQWAS